MSATFLANKGILGSALQTQKSEVVNDVHSDPRLFGKIESENGFVTQNLIAIDPGGDKIGVMDEGKKWKKPSPFVRLRVLRSRIDFVGTVVDAMTSRLSTHEPTAPPAITQPAVPGGKP